MWSSGSSGWDRDEEGMGTARRGGTVWMDFERRGEIIGSH